MSLPLRQSPLCYLGVGIHMGAVSNHTPIALEVLHYIGNSVQFQT